MQRASFADMPCAIAQALEVVGEWWTLLILRDAFQGVTRFDDFCHRLGISRNILSARLDKLVGAGVLDRTAYQERPVRYDYTLTEKGRELWPVLVTLGSWGYRWASHDRAVPVRLVHRRCGEPTSVRLTCDRCGEPLEADDIRLQAGNAKR